MTILRWNDSKRFVLLCLKRLRLSTLAFSMHFSRLAGLMLLCWSLHVSNVVVCGLFAAICYAVAYTRIHTHTNRDLQLEILTTVLSSLRTTTKVRTSLYFYIACVLCPGHVGRLGADLRILISMLAVWLLLHVSLIAVCLLLVGAFTAKDHFWGHLTTENMPC